MAVAGILSLASDTTESSLADYQETGGYHSESILPIQEELRALIDAEINERHGLPARLRFFWWRGCRAYGAYHNGSWSMNIEGELL